MDLGGRRGRGAKGSWEENGRGERRKKERRQRWPEGERNEEMWRKYRGTEMSFSEIDKKQQAGETEQSSVAGMAVTLSSPVGGERC